MGSLNFSHHLARVLTPGMEISIDSCIIRGDTTTYYKMTEYVLPKDVMFIFFPCMGGTTVNLKSSFISSVWSYLLKITRTDLTLPFIFSFVFCNTLPSVSKQWPLCMAAYSLKETTVNKYRDDSRTFWYVPRYLKRHQPPHWSLRPLSPPSL